MYLVDVEAVNELINTVSDIEKSNQPITLDALDALLMDAKEVIKSVKLPDNNKTVNNISLRDYFAGRVLNSLYINPESRRFYDENAHIAYKAADEMLKAREK